MVYEKSMIFTPTAFPIFRPRNTKQLHELRTLTVSPTEPTAGKCGTTVFHTDRSTECTEKWLETLRAVQIHHRAERPGKSSNQIIRWRVVYKSKFSSYIIWQYSFFFFFSVLEDFWRQLKFSEGKFLFFSTNASSPYP